MWTPSDLRQMLPPLTMPMVLRKASREPLLSNQPAACIDDSPNPSVGTITACRAEPWVTLTSGCALLLFEELERGHTFVFVFGVTGCESTAYMRLLASHVFTFFLSFFSCDSLHSPTHRPCLTPPSSCLASTTTSLGYPKVRSASTMTLSAESSSSDSLLATVCVNPIAYDADTSFSMEPGFDADKLLAHKLKTDNTSLPPLPSPHLCPRRTFLTSLISRTAYSSSLSTPGLRVMDCL